MSENRSAMKVVPLLVYLCVGLIVVGCNRQASSAAPQESTLPPIGRSLNPIRKGLGLRLIGDDWVLYRNWTTQEDWKTRNMAFLAKSIFKNTTGIVSKEVDYYYSGAEFTDIEGHDWENITFTYNFETKLVLVDYRGTNKVIQTQLSKFAMAAQGGSADLPGALAAVKQVTAGWPDGPK